MHTAHPVTGWVSAQILHCADEAGGSLELLRREHPQRIAHQDIRSIASCSSCLHEKPLMEHVERHYCQVRLCLSSASGKPDQIYDVALLRTSIANSLE